MTQKEKITVIRRKWSFEFTVSILIFVLVFVITWQLKGVKKNSEIRSRELMDRETLENYYIEEVQKNEKLKAEISNQSAVIEAFRDQVTSNSDAAAIIDERLSGAELYAGLTNVEGEGVVVTLDDVELTQEMQQSGMYSNYGIVHDVNISTFINELKAAGAEAISVNDERIVAMSEVRCVGPTIMVNGDRVAPPFIIKAIGDAEILESALKMSGGAAEEAIRIYGISVTIEKSDKLMIERFLGSTQTEYAKTITVEEVEDR